MRKAIDIQGREYFEYILLYTDDAFVISHKPEKILRDELGKYFGLKEASIGLNNGMEAWGFPSAQYIKNAVNNVEEKLNKDGEKLPKRAPTPFAFDYHPEQDLSPELPTDKASYYQSLIGILR